MRWAAEGGAETADDEGHALGTLVGNSRGELMVRWRPKAGTVLHYERFKGRLADASWLTKGDDHSSTRLSSTPCTPEPAPFMLVDGLWWHK